MHFRRDRTRLDHGLTSEKETIIKARKRVMDLLLKQVIAIYIVAPLQTQT